MNEKSFTLRLSLILGWQSLRRMYIRTVLGQFWITLGMAITILAIGLVFGLLFGVPLNEYLPYMATGLIIWTFFTGLITEGSQAFIVAEGYIRQLSISKMTYFYQVLWKQLFLLAHNIVIIPILLIIFPQGISIVFFLFLPGLVLALFSLSSFTLVLAVLSTRFRDLPQIIASVLLVLFYLTPVIWQPSSLPSSSIATILELNPLNHLLQIIRLPLLNQVPTFQNYFGALLFGIFFFIIAYFVYNKNKNKIAYWV